MEYGTLNYCPSNCYDAVNYASGGSPDGYDGSTLFAPIEYNTDYDVGSNGGQFVYTMSGSQLGKAGGQPEGFEDSYYLEITAWYLSYFTWFEA